MTLQTIDNDFNAVFETADGAVHQCDKRGLFIVTLFGEQIELKLCGLVGFKRKIFLIEPASMFEEGSPDVQIIYLPSCDRFFAFSTLEILELRELLEGTMAILRLNSLIHKETVRRPTFMS
ncbi:MAG: hypothetical protein AAGA85_00025 [Bacteroidota bacterium]